MRFCAHEEKTVKILKYGLPIAAQEALTGVSFMVILAILKLIYPALSKGYVDAVAAHETSILQYMADYNLEYRILEEPLMTVGLGVAFDKNDDSSLCDQLQKTLQDMLEDETIRDILSKYLEEPDKFLEVSEYGR